MTWFRYNLDSSHHVFTILIQKVHSILCNKTELTHTTLDHKTYNIYTGTCCMECGANMINQQFQTPSSPQTPQFPKCMPFLFQNA